MNGLNPFEYLKDVLERVVSGDVKAHQLDCLLPWNWKAERTGRLIRHHLSTPIRYASTPARSASRPRAATQCLPLATLHFFSQTALTGFCC